MFEGFDHGRISVDGVTIKYVIGGQGRPLLLLHGYPQSHVMWHKIAPLLAEDFTVVASDLRGYGESSKPPTSSDHAPYSKRAMAKDQVKMMQALGFDRFNLVGHDRGGRVSHRLALDHPDAVRRLVVMDIAPTYTMYRTTDMEFASAYYHWFFLIQPYDLPERLIESDPNHFLMRKFGHWGRDHGAFTKDAMAIYVRNFDREVIHASCEDYRASATIDLDHDQVDLDAGKKISCPMLCLWGDKGFVGQKYDVVKEWSKWADNVEGLGLPCGHYLPEEAPDGTLEALRSFLLH